MLVAWAVRAPGLELAFLFLNHLPFSHHACRLLQLNAVHDGGLGLTVVSDQFTDSLEMLDDRRLADSGADVDDVLLMLAQRYAYVVPSESALTMLAALGPLVEVGAGTGYWAHRLRSIGVDIVAFDHAPVDGERANRYHQRSRPWTHVDQGDQRVLCGHADRSLFLCWPPLFSSLGDCLDYYGGDTVACIGDGGYRTARLDHLGEAFTKVASAPVRGLDPYPGVAPQLTIWQRTPERCAVSSGAKAGVRSAQDEMS